MGKVGSKAILLVQRRTITFLHMFVFFHTFEGKKIEAAEAEALLLNTAIYGTSTNMAQNWHNFI